MRWPASGSASSEIQFYTGALIETHELVPYQSQGVGRGLTLRYSSLTADPRPIVHLGMDNVPFLGVDGRMATSLVIDLGGSTWCLVVFGTCLYPEALEAR